ncbi:MAG: VWA domain-containing protein [Acidobacteria bacterium]|nr:VWA domain-containing protein [Acidobacteriota bacterium]
MQTRLFGFIVIPANGPRLRLLTIIYLVIVGCAGPVGLALSQTPGPTPVRQSTVQDFADALLEGPSGRGGGLDVAAAFISGSEIEDAEGRIEVALDVVVRLEPGWGEGRELRVTLVAYNLEDEPLILEETVALPAPAGAALWVYRRNVLLREEFLEAVLVVEDLVGGRRGGARVGYGSPIAPAPTSLQGGVIVDDRGTALPNTIVPSTPRSALLRLVPPRGHSHSGKIKIRTLLTSDEVDRVEFLLDGQRVALDEREPFTLEIDLGGAPEAHEVVAIAMSAGGREIGRDRLLLNSRLELFDVRMVLSPTPGGGDGLRLEAAVTVPRDTELDRVEFYRSTQLLETQRSPPFAATVQSATLGPDDYLRVVAYLTDGSSLDDVRLVGEAAAGERIEVNLVQVFAVASDRRGEPLTDLEAEDFEVRLGKQRVEIERFELAVDIPLTLGLVFDTSGSMYSLMPDAKQAGARFLASIVREQDRAFLVDFDTRPRLAHPLTSDLGSLLRRFGQLEAKGRTALYDAVVFGTLQFDSAPGRRALVVLTDGVPSGGAFGARQCINLAVEHAVPVYSIDLSGILGGVSAAKLPLVGLAKATGGRVHTIEGRDPRGMVDYEAVSRALERAYTQIERELRSQYIMAFSTPQPLTADEIKSVKVKVLRSGVKVRRVVGTVIG